MIYTTGSIAVSGNTLTGTGTNFTAAGSLIRNGCTVLAMTSPLQAFQITSVDSATGLTVSPAASPAVPAGTKFAILLSDSLSVDGLAQDIAETFSMYQRYMGGFADVMNGSGDVTITINGQPVTVPGQKSLAKKGPNTDITSLGGLTTALSIQQGGTGAKDASQGWLNLLNGRTPATARGDLQLGTAAVRDTYSTTGAILSVGDFGIGGTSGGAIVTNANLINANGIWGAGGSGGLNYFDNYSPILMMFRTPTTSGQLQATIDGKLAVRGYNGSTMSAWNQCYTTGNTTRAADGTIKAASPIVRIVKSKEDCTRPDIDESDFEWCGAGVANAEAEGVTLTRQDTGVYLLKGSAGLAKSGWQMSPPRDPQGSGDMGIVEAEQGEDKTLIIRLYKRRYVLSDDGDIELQKGVAIDVPPTSWIDVRLDMPENSIWNQRAESAKEE
ncbi:phage tail protein [Kosakonia cowanii]|uniref:Phage tail protein n=1 Tax=Kosakonia cowanii JCM 10956 = DSM 18146 TaxID=1300165 RepID=A0A807LHX4_9ENTR|nr:hypothetical protein [Kosakonia cowanii]APZ06937.1 phage tail protein [Kosakonia cowanii] [Kosakonia cowanii JCM 10956 = DSM 18146]